ncbi:MAG: sulfite exporter TauE/SafE family protein [Candidatus Peribacteraceae bacterium]|jgi:hypothetical protein
MSFLIAKFVAIAILGFFTSFVGTTTGGMGIVLVPLLVFLGLSPHAAIATTRFAVLGGDIPSLDRLHRAGKSDAKLVLPVLILSIVGAFIGSELLLLSPGPLVEKLLGGFILLSVVLTFLRPALGVRPAHPSALRRAVGYVSLLGTSVLGTYFSAAAGMLGRTTLMACFGQTSLQSAATRKVQGIAMGVTGSLLFAWAGIISVPVSLVLFPSVLLGAIAGSSYALRKGDAWARSLFLLVALAAGISLLL